MIRTLSTFVFLAVAFSAAAHAAANQVSCSTSVPLSMTINYGDDVNTNCQLTEVGQIDLFLFQGNTGDDITIVVDSSWESPCADLYDPTDTLVKTVCGYYSTTASSGFMLAMTGQYTVRVHDVNYTSTGTFGLMLESWHPVVVASPLALGVSSDGTTVNGETIDNWTFVGTSGEDVTLQVQSSYESPCFILVGPTGVQSPQICGYYSTQARSEYTLSATGTYDVIVNSSGYGSTGTYSVLLQCLNDCTSAIMPSINGLSPSSATAGGPAFTLTVNGSGFLSGATVQWNGSALPTTYVNGNQLTATVQATLIAAPGSPSVTVTNPGGSASTAATFNINPPGFTLTPAFSAINASAATGSVTVSAPSTAAWTATSNSLWLTITGGGSGVGDGLVTYSVAANTGESRTGTLTIAGKIFTVTQYGPVYSTDPGITSSLQLVSGTVNGQAVSPSIPAITVPPGTALSGSLTVSINSSYPSNDVMAMGATPNWGPDSTSFIDLGGFSTPVSGLTRSVPVNWQAPATPGVYYIIVAFRDEFTAGEVMSCTNWSVGSLKWNDGNDVAEWSSYLIESAINVGSVAAAYTGEAGPTVFIPATAIRVVVTQHQAEIAPPFGSFDIPTNGKTGLAGGLPIGGWALSTIPVTVQIWRAPVPNEAAAANGLVFIQNATFVAGTRPDIASAYPGYLNSNAAGWGTLLLTNELPDSSGSGGLGNGTYTLHALTTDANGVTIDLGAHTITVNNAASVLPFGTIDTPADGATISGTAYVNFGWALTPQPNMIATNGSTINVFIDNIPVGHPVYNNPRADIEALFPGYANTNGAVGYFKINTTTLENGLHEISWAVTDSAGHKNGIGSRYFIVQN